MAQFGSIVGILITSPIHRKLGYKKAVLLMLVLSAGLVAVPFFATSGEMLLTGFFFQGVPWGVFQVLSPGYSSEIASLQLRPILTTWNNMCWVIGQFISAAIIKIFEHVQGDMSFRIPFAIQWIFTVVLFVAVSFAPESPYWHLESGRVSEARAAAKKLVRKGSPERTEEKLALMRHTIHQENKEDHGVEGNAWQRLKGLLQGSDRRRTEIACIAWLIQAMCGSSIIGWAPGLFKTAGLNDSDAYSVNIALPAAGLFGTLGSWWLMLKWGRRKIYFWGLVTMGILLALVGFATFAPGSAGGWSAGGILIVFTAVYDLTIGPICYSIVSEIPSIRRRTSTLSAARGTYLSFNLINHFLAPKMFLTDQGSWGWGGKGAWPYAVICAISAVYTWFRIPETNGVSARELDILFQHRIKARDFSNALAAQLDAQDQENVTTVRSHSSVCAEEPKKAE